VRLSASILITVLASTAAAQEQPFLGWLQRQADSHFATRSTQLAALRTTADLELRKAFLRARTLELIGGLPDYAGPLNATLTGTSDMGSYVFERVLFESLPGIWVTGNVYRPAAAGRYPAVLIPSGHWLDSKGSSYRVAANLAQKGFVVLAYDPLGQGERQQGAGLQTDPSYYDLLMQHLFMGAQSVLLGQNFARYRIWDGKRALDYLTSRADVDASRIGMTGCSGGGTLTSYIAALDERVKVAAPACSTYTFRTLYGVGVGDSEQSLHNYLSSGLDLPDYILMAAPRPWLIVFTTGDRTPWTSARYVYDEAQPWYQLYGAGDKLGWYLGPGEHGWTRDGREAIYAWMIRWLKNGIGDATELDSTPFPPLSFFQVTAAGQVGGRNLFELLRETPRQAGTVDEATAWVKARVGHSPAAVTTTVATRTVDADVVIDDIAFESEGGLPLQARLLYPSTPGVKPATLLVESDLTSSGAATALARSGRVVLQLLPRGLPLSPYYFKLAGEWEAATRALMIGRDLPSLRAYDILRGVDLLANRADVDGRRIGASAKGVAGVWLLVAAVADTRIASVQLEGTPYSFRAALDNAFHYRLHDAAMPGFALRWDLSTLAAALGNRTIVWSNPTDWLDNVVTNALPPARMTAAVASKGTAGSSYFVDVTVSNTGPSAAMNVFIQSLTFRTLLGTGAVTTATPTPIIAGNLPAGATVVIRVLLNKPGTIQRFSMTEAGTLQTVTGTTANFTLSQAIAP
jgi:hypothetical protein